MLLNILIPTLPERKERFEQLIDNLQNQIADCNSQHEISIISDCSPRVEHGGITTGEKRNKLLERATAEYVWQVDCDDIILPGAIKRVVNACRTGCDVVGINGFMTTDGNSKVGWEIRLNNPYIATERNGVVIYERWPNHITPMKRKHAIKIKFQHINIGEDYKWSVELKEANLLQTQEIINEPVYHYDYRTIK